MRPVRLRWGSEVLRSPGSQVRISAGRQLAELVDRVLSDLRELIDLLSKDLELSRRATSPALALPRFGLRQLGLSPSASGFQNLFDHVILVGRSDGGDDGQLPAAG